ncbi:macrolide-specific efflux system membrane fusion protein [Actinoplanes octamycinicus]|uniref:Macrolide-specific efflux system membrane fusion protein n=1 Tax=Actinoplanes octamycinicus TaxID=135948 RepID=A0A7W7M845_9ACTN|nr:efflux RND transporter periplasmic adaptor subunit [Actinoplanes octamycinicus]MBB4740475.1 macrolide-specific efflux system membrane fusion protein [Actinoplanes octamycinicus]GIE59735.1 RND transporter [Actinoplanes octamycinicus]
MKALRRPSTAINALLALLIVGAAIWGVNLIRSTSSGNSAKATDIRTVTVSQGTVTRTVSADGTVESASTAAATFTTAGTVTSIQVKVGDKVSKGQQLAAVDPTDAERELALAQANLDAANDALDRAEAAGTDTTTAENEVTSATLAVADAKATVAGAKLTAPMAGTVTAVNGSLGGSSSGSGSSSTGGAGGSASSSSASTGSGGFIDLADLSKLQITAAFSEADATSLKAGQSATITWNALENAETTGKVLAVDPTATTSNGVVTYGVTISLPNPPDGAKPGQTVSVAVVTGSVENATMVNSAAVTVSGRRSTVTVLGGTGQQEVRQVQVGLEGDDAYQITSGLAAGEKVVVPTSSTTGSGTANSRSGFGAGGGGFTGGGGAPPGGR